MSDFLGDVGIGKAVGGHLYIHASGLSLLPAYWQKIVAQACGIAQLKVENDFNVLKLQAHGEELSLLDYRNFFHDPFPPLARSWRVSLSKGSVIFRNYEESRNPPILHRKELLLPPSDPRIQEYSALTKATEALGLFSETSRIGFREHWYALIAERGYELIGGQFIPLANEVNDTVAEPDDQLDIRRHLTALSRSNFSAPVQALLRHGLIQPETTFFDYGCGRGDDVRGLLANGIDAVGWDPHYALDAEKREADVVNLGFVINVIENLEERVQALKGAYSYATGILTVAAMLTSQTLPDGRPYRDGYLSSRNTFQKYFSQAQLRDFIEHTLDENAIAAGPGVFFVFRDKEREQRFLAARYGQRVQTVLSRGWVHNRQPRQPRVRLNRGSRLFEANQRIFESLWLKCLELGRRPNKEEIDRELLDEINVSIGGLSAALKIVFERYDVEKLNLAGQSKISDLLVLGALQQFQKRKPYRHLEAGMQRDIRHFFGDYPACQAAARQILFNISNLKAIGAACCEASENGYGWLEEGRSLQLHASLLERLPTILRVYVGCATLLCGDTSEFDLLKIHIRSGKVTLMKFDDFENSPLPRLQQRIKVNLRDQDLDVFSYGAEYAPTLLYYKSRFINEEFPRYSEQVEFEDELSALGIHDLSGYGPPESEFFRSLETARWRVDGFKLVRSRLIPDLDEPCGANFTYRQLIECGETQLHTGLANLPTEPDSYTALFELATAILDPVIDYFGMVKLTFGFCSAPLAKRITARIAPELDQHAAHEKKKNGRFICERLGAACDFIVEDEDMELVAHWVFENTNVDRIYLYGNDRPIHVSCSANPARQLVRMLTTSTGRMVPQVVKTTT